MSDFAGISINLGALIGVLYGLVAVMLLVILYHVLFILVDLRKITRRFEDVTSQVEAVILKPLSIADQAVQWVSDFIAEKQRAHQKASHTHLSKAHPKKDADEE